MHHTIDAGHDLDEGAVALRTHHFAGVDPANGGLFGHGLDLGNGALDPGAVGGRHKHRSIVLDVDFDAVLLLHGPDDLAAWADDLADLVGVDLDGDDARCEGRHLFARFGQHGQHLVQNEQPALTCLFQRLSHHLEAQPLDLHVHLEGGDAVAGTGDLEVHIAQVIFHALNVRQDSVATALRIGDQAHGDTGDGGFDWHARVHERQGAAADRCHRGGAIGAQHL